MVRERRQWTVLQGLRPGGGVGSRRVCGNASQGVMFGHKD